MVGCHLMTIRVGI